MSLITIARVLFRFYRWSLPRMSKEFGRDAIGKIAWLIVDGHIERIEARP